MAKSIKQRETKFDLIRVIAICLILISHALPKYGTKDISGRIDITQSASDVQGFIVILLNYCGQIGNVLFIASASWFLVDKDKNNYARIFKIILDTLVVSLAVFGVFVVSGIHLTMKQVIKAMLPITTNSLWFIGCYILLYLMHPGLNTICRSLSDKKFKGVVIIVVILYCGIQFVIEGAYSYNSLVGFIIVYLFTAYVKRINQKHEISQKTVFRVIFGALAGHILLIAVTNIAGQKISMLSGQMNHWNTVANPFIILIGVFSIVEVNNYWKNGSNFWYDISKNSLLIYIISENGLIRNHLKPKLWNEIYTRFSYDYLLIEILIVFLGMFAASCILAVVYGAFSNKFINPLSKFAEKQIMKLCKKNIIWQKDLKK